jgi:hypothetical protein
MKIGVLVPVCSRKQDWKTYEECYLHRALLPSFEETKSDGYEYVFYVGVDDDDVFFLENADKLPGVVVVLSDCRHAPARAWNRLFRRAYDDGCDYFFQLADDVVLETPGWTERFLTKLQENSNKGVVGPCHLENYEGRKRAGKSFVLENAFVHRTHYELFHTFYPEEIQNWYCDDWITQVYQGVLSYMFEDIRVRNLSIRTGTERYVVSHVDLTHLVEEGRIQLRMGLRGCFSFCLYGDYTDKYYKGLQENIVLIREHYPNWDILVYTAPEAEAYVEGLGVRCIPTLKTGPVNMTYRFLPITDPTYDVVCVRDTDSRIHERDRWCISHFLDSPYRLYTIRDHPYHRYRIMGGLWGAKRGSLFAAERLADYCETVQAGYTADTRFLDTHVAPKNMVIYSYVSHGLFHDPNEKVVLIECPLPNGDFCGNVVLYHEDGTTYTQFTQT